MIKINKNRSSRGNLLKHYKAGNSERLVKSSIESQYWSIQYDRIHLLRDTPAIYQVTKVEHVVNIKISDFAGIHVQDILGYHSSTGDILLIDIE